MSNRIVVCKKCSSQMIYWEGEDEFSSNELRWYAQWTCPNCHHYIRDYEEDFEFPDDNDDPAPNEALP
jgi:hypothetical protein